MDIKKHILLGMVLTPALAVCPMVWSQETTNLNAEIVYDTELYDQIINTQRRVSESGARFEAGWQQFEQVWRDFAATESEEEASEYAAQLFDQLDNLERRTEQYRDTAMSAQALSTEGLESMEDLPEESREYADLSSATRDAIMEWGAISQGLSGSSEIDILASTHAMSVLSSQLRRQAPGTAGSGEVRSVQQALALNARQVDQVRLADQSLQLISVIRGAVDAAVRSWSIGEMDHVMIDPDFPGVVLGGIEGGALAPDRFSSDEGTNSDGGRRRGNPFATPYLD